MDIKDILSGSGVKQISRSRKPLASMKNPQKPY